MTRQVHPIERESYRILRHATTSRALAPLSRAVAERVCHASADLSFADTLVLDEQALERGREALLAGARDLRQPHDRRRDHLARRPVCRSRTRARPSSPAPSG